VGAAVFTTEAANLAGSGDRVDYFQPALAALSHADNALLCPLLVWGGIGAVLDPRPQYE
jgi:hypothetical protein